MQATAIKDPLAFGPQDGDLFLRLGRQTELGQLLGHVLVRGKSGAGKTSLLRAGLARVLQDQDPPIAYHYWEAVPEKPAERLLAAIRQSWPAPDDPPYLATPADLFAPGVLPGRHVIVLDQFEQLDCHNTDHQPIFALLKKLLVEAVPPHPTTPPGSSPTAAPTVAPTTPTGATSSRTSSRASSATSACSPSASSARSRRATSWR